jgi:predicted transcriptional regulator
MHDDYMCSHKVNGMSRKSIGDQELALLQHIAEHGDASVGEVATTFGEPRGLARSTVLTMMERLRAKAYLKRKQVDGGVYRYSTTAQQDDVVRNAVGSFVEKTLQGSVSPFVAWMSQRTEVSDNELAELEALVATLQSKRKES